MSQSTCTVSCFFLMFFLFCLFFLSLSPVICSALAVPAGKDPDEEAAADECDHQGGPAAQLQAGGRALGPGDTGTWGLAIAGRKYLLACAIQHLSTLPENSAGGI